MIPDYQKLFKPVLNIYKDGKEHSLQEAVTIIGDFLKLDLDQRARRLSSGQTVLHNRVSWAHSYLRQAKAIESVSRGVNKITDRGVTILKDNPDNLDNHYLTRFDSFVEFKNRKRAQSDKEEIANDSQTPDERINTALEEHNDALGSDLLERLRCVDAFYFEKIVGDLMVKMGYGSVEVTKRTNDGGIDAIVNEDALGLSKIFVQAKRYSESNKVNGKEIRDFVGALEMRGVKKGVFITTSSFHTNAENDLRATQKSIILVDGKTLAGLMINYELAVSTERIFKLRQIDSDYLSGEI